MPVHDAQGGSGFVLAGRAFEAGRGELWSWQPGKKAWDRHAIRGVTSMAMSGGQCWALTRSNEIFRAACEGSTWQSVGAVAALAQSSGLRVDLSLEFLVVTSGTVLVGGQMVSTPSDAAPESRAVVFEASEGHDFSELIGLSGRHVTALAKDNRGALWVVTDSGVFCRAATQWQLMLEASPGSSSQSVAVQRRR